MAEAILAQLKISKKPIEQTVVSIQYKKAEPKKEVKIDAKIVDKRPTSQINRTELLAKLEKKLDVESKISVKKIEEEKKEFDELAAIKELEKEEVDESQVAAVAEVVSAAASAEQLEDKPITRIKKRTLVLRPPPTAVPILKPKHTVISGAIDIKSFEEKLPLKEPTIEIRSSAYYMNNREIFINFITALLQPYKDIIDKGTKDHSCETKEDAEFNLLTHQKIVRDYINLYAPYRGLLLYHGLGSGKTCSSIGIAEGLKTDKKIIIMIPAALEVNYKEELKKCGDKLYKKNQYWEFINTTTNPTLIEPLSSVLSLSVETIKKNGGAWFVNVKEAPNYNQLSATKQQSLDKQLDEMIQHKYEFIRYNGLRQQRLDLMVKEAGGNPFNNKVIIIDEAHNFVSRIVNKLKKKGEPLFIQLYKYLMNAENVKIILLTGTPIINYPNEIGITMNILRGVINTWQFKLSINAERKVTQETLLELFNSNPRASKILDYLQYKPTSSTLIITRNPYGFFAVGKQTSYKGVELGEDGNVDDVTFIQIITQILADNEITIVPTSVEVKKYTCLPDTLEGFSSEFIDASTSTVRNMNKFKSRILGLVSYFPDIDALLPRYNRGTDFHIISIPMSDFQFSVYEEARVEERKIEKNNAKKRAQSKKKGSGGEIYEDAVSTYRIFSRAFCNYVFPRPDIRRPLPREATDIASAIEETADEDLLDAISIEEKIKNTEGKYDEEELAQLSSATITKINKSYEERIKEAINLLDQNKDKYLRPEALEVYSPKFLNILSKLIDESYNGLHLIYSQFRTLEGIGILSLVLKANGFAQFKIAKVRTSVGGYEWMINISVEDRGKPKYVLYTGTENPEEKEIVRNIFNSNWDLVPESLRAELQKISSNNLYGEIIKVIMITASGAEGISLSNVRYVHITEPYWHPVRIEQVIGRARRICSHKNLPKELRTVEVFVYLMSFTKKQLTPPPKGGVDLAIELRVHDKSKLDPTKVLTSDEALFEIATIKENINRTILHNIKEASIDCSIHRKLGSKDKLQCFTFGKVNSSKFAYNPSIADQEHDEIADINKVEIKLKLKKANIAGKDYAIDIGKIVKENEDENGIIITDVYTLDSAKSNNPIQVGYLQFKNLKAILPLIPL